MNHANIQRSLVRATTSLAFVLCTWATMSAQSTRKVPAGQADACKERLKGILTGMMTAIEQAPREAFAVEMTLHATNAQGTQDVKASAHFEEGRIFFETPQYRYYHDPKIRLAVVPDDHQAYVYENPGKDRGEERMQAALQWRDTLLWNGTIADDRIKRDLDGSRREIIVMVPPPNMDWMGMRSITWTIDPDRHLLLESLVEYGPGHALTSLQVDYRRFAPGERDPRATRSLAEEFLADGGQTGPLKGYILNDRRRHAQ